MTKDEIRRVFLKHGLRVKKGKDDFSPKLYRAAEEIIDEVSHACPYPTLPPGFSMMKVVPAEGGIGFRAIPGQPLRIGKVFPTQQAAVAEAWAMEAHEVRSSWMLETMERSRLGAKRQLEEGHKTGEGDE